MPQGDSVFIGVSRLLSFLQGRLIGVCELICALFVQSQASQDQTPSPAVLQYANCLDGQQPRQNGNHPARLGAPQPTTPQPPSSLALGVSQRTHTGETPLIALTPDISQPHPHPPPAVTGNHPDENRSPSSGEYASVGMGSPGPMPIYDNTTIAGLASNVQLKGAEVANQTNV
jgi:hypothetical protein